MQMKKKLSCIKINKVVKNVNKKNETINSLQLLCIKKFQIVFKQNGCAIN